MLYSTCPTCGYFIGQKIIEWEIESKNICDDPNLNKEEKEKLKEKLLKKIKLRRYCCRMRLMSYKDLVQDITAVTEET